MKVSAGILLFRRKKELEVLLVHPGGPYFKNKDNGWWGIPKGELNEGEDMLSGALRELKEETGIEVTGEFLSLGGIRQNSYKIVYVWGIEGDWDGLLRGQSFVKIEWPPKSGKIKSFPEVDRVSFFSIKEARKKIHIKQEVFLDRLLEKI